MLRLAAGFARQLQLARHPAWQQAVQKAAFSAQSAICTAAKVTQGGGGIGTLTAGPLSGLGECLRQPVQQQGRSAVLGLRHFSLQQNLQEASQKVKAALEVPVKAYQTTRKAVAQTYAAVYSKMPRQVKQWVDAAQSPGTLNRVLSLQLEAFWQQHGKAVMVMGALAVAYAIWRTLYAVASRFVDMSDTSALLGFLGLASTTLMACYLYMRRRFSVDPSAVYRLAMLRLNTDPGLLEVMGAPVAGSALRATVLTGGGLRFQGLRPRVQSRRLQMIFPLKGSERRGLVSLEAKKRRGRYSFKLLAVDVPSAVGGEQRIFLQGDEAIYSRGGVLAELREPFTRAVSLQDAYELEDEADELEDEEEAKREKEQRLLQRLERAPKALDDGGGMFVYERAWFALRGAFGRAWQALKGLQTKAKLPESKPS